MEMWLCDLKRALWAIAMEKGNLACNVAKIVGNCGNIDFYFTNGEKWTFISQSDEMIKYDYDWRR